MPITRTVQELARDDPHRPAIVGPHGSIGYGRLWDDARRVTLTVDAALAVPAASTADAAIGTGGIPVIVLSLSSDFEAARLVAALFCTRAVAAVLDPSWPLEHRVEAIRAAAAALVVTDSDELTTALRAGRFDGAILPPTGLTAADLPATEPTPERDDDEPFLLLHSSGTTSRPKAFVKTRGQYRANLRVSCPRLEALPGEHTLAPGPVSYSLTLYAVVECLATGGTVHLADAADPAVLTHRIRDEHITRIVAVPAVVRALVALAGRSPGALDAVRLVVTGGAELPASLRSALGRVMPGARAIGYYGTSEIGFIGDSRDADGLIELYDGVEVEVRDEHGRAVSPGATGALWVRAASCSEGYLATTTDAVLRDADGWASVGDLGRLAPDGRLDLVGRAGDVTVTGGHTIALTEVERAFDGVPGLGPVCAVALPDAALGHVVALLVEAEAPDKRELLARARRHLAPQYVPRRWYRVDRLPRTAGGKLRRAAAAALVGGAKDGADDGASEAGRAVRL